MFALAMVLTAAMISAGEENASEKAGRGLALQGKWEGSLRINPDFTVPASYQDGRLTAIRFGKPESVTVEFIDQGEGKCRCRISGGGDALGIYRWQGQQLILCIGRQQQRPSSIRVEDGFLLTLQRVKPVK